MLIEFHGQLALVTGGAGGIGYTCVKTLLESGARVAILERGGVGETGTVEEVFSKRQTEAGRRLVYPEGVQIDQLPAANVVRVAFNGGSSYEPLIASLAIDCGVKVNILAAHTRNVNGRAFGTMLLGLPQDKAESAKAMTYLKAQKDVTVEEVRDSHE